MQLPVVKGLGVVVNPGLSSEHPLKTVGFNERRKIEALMECIQRNNVFEASESTERAWNYFIRDL
jgi:hypothetical protein